MSMSHPELPKAHRAAMPDLQDEAALASWLVENTGVNIFLTGRAGTGKTTFLRRLAETSAKRMVITAPTGIAAINAGGVTLHSFFQLDFNAMPGASVSRRFDRFSKAKRDIIRSLDLLVIDEISMVRADLLDRVDGVLRRHRDPLRPFGGVQLLMIGDLHQLPPVVTENEAAALSERYASPYFFESHALREAGFKTVCLTHIYRQTDSAFITLLNKIRVNAVDSVDLERLNRCVGRRFEEGRSYVRLMTHNHQARAINVQMLSMLPGPEFSFSASIEGKFPESACPGEPVLSLRKGAQVMFIKNDLQRHEYYNGLLAEVTHVDAERIVVRTVEGKEMQVRMEEWVNNTFRLDDEDGEIKEVREGAFRQYPLRLAWAITIHKSQGLTFDRAVIDAASAFAHGQTYVALSRCRSLEGLSLERPLTAAAVITDPVVCAFMEREEKASLTPDMLAGMHNSFRAGVLSDLFGFRNIGMLLEDMRRIILTRLPQEYAALGVEWAQTVDRFRTNVTDVAERFSGRFAAMAADPDSEAVRERIASGAVYFASELQYVADMMRRTPCQVDNRDVSARLTSLGEDIWRVITVRRGLLECFASEPLNPETYYRKKSALENNADRPARTTKKRGASPAKEKSPKKEKKQPAEVLNPSLYEDLTAWRRRKAAELKLPAYRVFYNAAAVSISNAVPLDVESLAMLPAVSASTASQFGSEILKVIEEWKKKR